MCKKNKRLVAVEVSLKHGFGKEYPDMLETIFILPGQSFKQGFEADTLYEGDTIVRQYNWKAGYTVVYEYFYQ